MENLVETLGCRRVRFARRDRVVYQCLRSVPLGQVVTDRLIARMLVLSGYAATNTHNAIHIAAFHFNQTLGEYRVERIRGVGYRLCANTYVKN